MGLSGEKTFLGIGFGPIQSGLFIREAFFSGNFKRIVIVEIKKELVKGVRNARGIFNLNTAFQDRIVSEEIGPIEILDPRASKYEYERVITAISDADEISTAIPSVNLYESGGEYSVASMISTGLLKKQANKGPKCVIYTAENNNQAAEFLQEAILKRVKDFNSWMGTHVQILNTVIGKMSQVVQGEEELAKRNLTPIAVGINRAFLVESFNEILISKINIDDEFSRGIAVFREKINLLPFEEAKLYGHNSTHALIGYLGKIMGLSCVNEMMNIPGFYEFVHRAFIKESGRGLIRKYGGVDDLFTEDGYQRYAVDLLERMVNPYLNDSIDRIIRDPERKLGWNDRLIGTIRMAKENGVEAKRFTLGAAAAISVLLKGEKLPSIKIEEILTDLWAKDMDDYEVVRPILSDINNAYILFNDNLHELQENPPAFFENFEKSN